MRVLEAAPAARTTVQSPQRRPGGDAWRESYLNPARLCAAAREAARAAHEQSLATARTRRQP